jgi:hypothetical protein
MDILFFLIAVVVSLPVAAIVLVSVASKREDQRFSLGRPAPSPVQRTARRILDFSTETRADWATPAGYSERAGYTERAGFTARADYREPAELDRPGRAHRRIDSPLLATRMVNFRHAA